MGNDLTVKLALTLKATLVSSGGYGSNRHRAEAVKDTSRVSLGAACSGRGTIHCRSEILPGYP